MSVVLNRTVRLLVSAGAAKPGPAIGQALGPLGLNMAEFCKQFNDRTKGYDKDIILPVKLYGNHTLCHFSVSLTSLTLSHTLTVTLIVSLSLSLSDHLPQPIPIDELVDLRWAGVMLSSHHFRCA
eukprot:scaffold537_cov180-Ochromonas_danica.AAC.82